MSHQQVNMAAIAAQMQALAALMQPAAVHLGVSQQPDEAPNASSSEDRFGALETHLSGLHVTLSNQLAKMNTSLESIRASFSALDGYIIQKNAE
jgi:hypothetical protein